MNRLTMNRIDNHYNAYVNFNLNNQYCLNINDHEKSLSSPIFMPNISNINQQKQCKPVGIFWDIENCTIPRGLSPSYLVEKIRSLIRRINLIEKEFAIVCDVTNFSSIILNELNNTQVNLIHVNSFAKNAADEKLKQLIIRFVQSNGSNSAVILFSSDINFASILSDIKNRMGVFVILFHHQQVSPALIASSHYHYDYDEFCAISASQSNNTLMNNRMMINFHSDSIMTLLRISNLPTMTEEQTRVLLNRIVSNNGGRIISINRLNHEAIVKFKCRSDALRCHQRIDNRNFFGSIVKSKLESNYQNNSSTHIQSSSMLYNSNVTSSQAKNDQRTTINFVALPSMNDIQSNSDDSLTRCKTCDHSLRKKSKYHDFLSSKQIFNINLNFREFSKNLTELLSMHNGKMMLNSLPDCWLYKFNSELGENDCDGPKIMLEHLVTMVPNVSIEFIGIKDKLRTKFIILDSKDKQSAANSSRKLENRIKLFVKKFISNLYTLLSSQVSNKLTNFSSISLDDFEKIYQNYFDENINYNDYGFTNLMDLLELCKEKFSIYTYDNDKALIAFNFKEQSRRFLIELMKLYPYNLSDPNYFNDRINPAYYGACSIQDMILAIDMRPKLINYRQKIREALIKFPFDDIPAVTKEFEMIKLDLKEKLLSSNDFSMNLFDFYENFSENLLQKSNISVTYCHLAHIIINNSDFEIKMHALLNQDRLMLNIDQQLKELGLRFSKIFNKLSTISFINNGNVNLNGNEMNVAISIYELIYQYYRRHETIDMKLLSLKSMKKLFEKILINSPSLDNYCQIFTASNVLLYRYTNEWRQNVQNLIFLYILQNRYSSTDFQLKKTKFDQLRIFFENNHRFSFDLSLFRDERIGQIIKVSKNHANEEIIVDIDSKYEIVVKCFIVMILHQKLLFSSSKNYKINGLQEQEPRWTIDQIENEFYDHYGVEMIYTNQLNKTTDKKTKSLIDLFKLFDFLFEIHCDDQQHTTMISIKKIETFDYGQFNRLLCCNYCQMNDTKFSNKIYENSKIDQQQLRIVKPMFEIM